MNGHLISNGDTHLGGFGLKRLTDSCSGSEEQLYSCSSSSEASVYLDVEPYFGDIDFHGSRDHSPCRAQYRASLSQKYIAKAADLVTNLSLNEKKEGKDKKEKKEEKKEKKKEEEDDDGQFILFYDDKQEEKGEEKLRRASSLKSPGSPPPAGVKKIVRFADVMGLDLADVRTFLDEVPKVPRSAFRDLEVEIAASPPVAPEPSSLVPLFQQPFASGDFSERLRQTNVCLESSATAESRISGTVRVVNLGFHKAVTIRHTLDGWVTSTDNACQYVPSSCDGFSDKFSFCVQVPQVKPGDRLEFAVRYQVNGQEFWDNHSGANYSYQCVPAARPYSFAAFSSPSHSFASPSPPWAFL